MASFGRGTVSSNHVDEKLEAAAIREDMSYASAQLQTQHRVLRNLVTTEDSVECGKRLNIPAMTTPDSYRGAARKLLSLARQIQAENARQNSRRIALNYSSRETPITSQPIADELPGGLPARIRTPHGTLDDRAGSGWSPGKL
jgi:SpoVK/Ycf46/Vps4 family AAA+-type ATPase